MWYIQSIILRIQIKKKNNMEKISVTNKMLILIPHADDELIGCFSLLKNNDCFGFYFNYTGNDSSETNINQRLSEFEKLTQILDLPFNINQLGNVKKQLSDLIKKSNFDGIFLPSFIDWNTEHVLVNKILSDVLNELHQNSYCLPYIYLYQISVPIPDLYLNSYLSLSRKEQIRKWKIFNSIYKSQRHLPSHRFKLQEKINGYYVHKFAAEIYAKMNYEKWSKEYKSSELYIENYSSTLKKNINNLLRMKKTINLYYNYVNRHTPD